MYNVVLVNSALYVLDVDEEDTKLLFYKIGYKIDPGY